MEQISRLIEDEVERRVTEKLTEALEKISQTYDISLRQLLRDIGTSGSQAWNGNVCHGTVKSGQKCKRGVKDGSGYCVCHRDQRPVPRVVAPPSRTPSMGTLVQHTHTLPPMFLAGCPACDRGKNSRIDI
jgi:hypothetical protein